MIKWYAHISFMSSGAHEPPRTATYDSRYVSVARRLCPSTHARVASSYQYVHDLSTYVPQRPGRPLNVSKLTSGGTADTVGAGAQLCVSRTTSGCLRRPLPVRSYILMYVDAKYILRDVRMYNLCTYVRKPKYWYLTIYF
jgi:hypothetical protein